MPTPQQRDANQSVEQKTTMKTGAPTAAAAKPDVKETASPATSKKRTSKKKNAGTTSSKKRRLCWKDGKLEVCGK
jgi:hypothetical protein